ncbi:MAG: hypothetical protein VYB32_08080, partial [Pseudomonadota bacterium]|nr:hypothetical protein [Pseudomonadota bacterium]
MVLEHWGFLCHVRRSRKVDERDGEPGWERVTAPNAYYFDCEARMPKAIWHDFWKALVSNLKRVAKIAARAASVIKAAFNSAAKPAPRAQNTELRMLLDRMADGIDRRDQALSPPATASVAASAASSEGSP